MDSPRGIAPDLHILPSGVPLPGFGFIPVNAFLITAQQPVLVDTGLMADRDAFMQNLGSLIDLKDLRWLYLTHPDPDHVGSLRTILDQAPQVRLVTNFIGYGILSLSNDIPLNRVYFLNPGEKLDVGDRTLTALKPPIFDSPATTGFIDSKTGVLFSSDCFGALLPEPAQEAADIDAEVLRRGQTLWSTVDSPWVLKVDHAKHSAEVNALRQLAPELILSSHLPPAHSIADRLLDCLEAAPGAEPFVGPNQAALEALMSQLTGGPPA
jgi:flavorubredoxin